MCFFNLYSTCTLTLGLIYDIKTILFGWAWKFFLYLDMVSFQLIDLGEPPFSGNSHRFCTNDTKPPCDASYSGMLQQFIGNGPKQPNYCSFSVCKTARKGIEECREDEQCSIKEKDLPASCMDLNQPVTLGMESYSSIALSFLPNSLRLSIQLKFKTQSTNGLLVKLSSQETPWILSLQVLRIIIMTVNQTVNGVFFNQLQEGNLCLVFSTKDYLLESDMNNEPQSVLPFPLKLNGTLPAEYENMLYPSRVKEDDNTLTLCLTKRSVADGAWHQVFASRMGHNLFLEVSVQT